MDKDFESKVEEILTRGVSEVIDREHLKKCLLKGEKLRIKHGVDPTTPDLHLGYAVVYRKLKQLQDLGHQIVFLIGDFTGRFGDPTDREKIREMKKKEDVKELAKNYINQLGKILDIKKVEVRHNGEWYDKMSAEELLKLMSKFTTRRMLERDMFKERDRKGLEIGLHEPVYPVLQGYDSVMLKSDLTVIGSDQKFNELQGRKIQEIYGQEPQDIIIMPVLAGTDGKQKMSQSLGNYIGLTEDSDQMFGKIMSIPDTSITNYYELCTDVPMESIKKIEKDMKSGKLNPRDAKLDLAQEIVKIYHGEDNAKKAREYFIKTFSERKTPENIPEQVIEWVEAYNAHQNVMDFMVSAKLATSRSDARRKIEQGGVSIDGKKVIAGELILTPEIYDGKVVKVGKIHFVKIKFK
ncbi:MAG: tyrosine--tRNA ligase [Candidatus Moranbacteria bacterium]|nr:tyrosine--tRNA ligase [Candidatus Moranbacteria bacterium]